ncbi:MAG: response regulator [Nannocystaceae bacterium]|nr:response regulator [Myxococcales bacterium]
MLTRASELFAFVTAAPALVGEEVDARDRKRTLCSVLLFGALALLGIGCIFAFYGQGVASALSFSYLIHVFGCFMVLRVAGVGFAYAIYANCFLIHGVAFTISWLSGGFLPSGCLYIWAFASPLVLALLPRGGRNVAALSMVVFMFLLGVLLYAAPTDVELAPGSESLTRMLTMVNLGLFSTLVVVSTATLVKGLASATANLQALNRTLDHRVQQRTAELEQANDELRLEVLERKRAEEALVESESRLRHAQKMESVGRLAGGIAHDFNNLLTVMLSYCEILMATLESSDPSREDVAEIQRAAERASKLTRQLLAFGRQQIFEVGVIDPNGVVEEMIPMLERLIGESISLDVTMDPRAGRVLADRGQLEQVLMNLVVNARDAMPDGGVLRIATGTVDVDDKNVTAYTELESGSYVKLEVSDNGHGMDEGTRARIFDPFFTTKPTGKGTGLGLSTAYGIIKQSEGAILVESQPNHGSTFTVLLPKTNRELETSVVTPKKPGVRAGNETILLVEDEVQVRAVVQSVLQRNGYEVLPAEDASAALAIVRTHEGDIDLLLTDLVMPHMNGRQLAEELLKLRPGLKIVYMTGYSSDVAVRLGVSETDLDFLTKPILPATLLAAVRDVLAEVPRRRTRTRSNSGARTGTA